MYTCTCIYVYFSKVSLLRHFITSSYTCVITAPYNITFSYSYSNSVVLVHVGYNDQF